MTKIYILLLSLLSVSLFAQKDYSRYHNSWRLGLNAGFSWQTADIRSCLGGGGGFTLEKGIGENATNFLSWAIRGRYLGANTYGMSPNRNYDVITNKAYNGSYNPVVNYNDSVSAAKRYIYDNYKTTLHEGSLELQVTFNRLREQKHVLLNLWAGIGFTSYRTYFNMLDNKDKRYDFTKIDSTGNASSALSSYNDILDDSYESYGLGSKAGNVVTLSPSGGIGLGYQFSPGFSMLWEYKVTVPQGINADLLDGKYVSNIDKLGGNNDYYHYTGLNLLFTLRGKDKTKEPVKKDEEVYTYTPPTNTVVPTNSISATTPTVVSTQTQVLPKPIVTFITPSVSGHVSNSQQYQISAQILNIDNANQIKFWFNNALITNFTFNSSTHILTYNTNLNVGENPVQIKATNSAGSDNEYIMVVYEIPQVEQGNPPTITITTPRQCPFTTTTQQYNLVARTTYITNKNQITVKVNNTITSNFNYDVNTGIISLPLSLVSGNNNIAITVANNYGNAVANCTIIYNQVQELVSPPVITIINPPQNGYLSANQSYVVNATVLNVASANNISLYYNGVSTPFTYNVNTKQFSFTANLNEGSNTIAINAYNAAGEDNKTTSVVYHAPVQGKLPIVNLITPNQINTTHNVVLYNFKFGVDYVSTKNDITVTINGNTTTSFIYNSLSKDIAFSSSLINGTNTVTVKGSNQYGIDSKTVYVIYRPIEVKNPPKVIFVNPAMSPVNSAFNTYQYKATITNVSNSSGLIVKYNGTLISNYSYNGSVLTYTASLVNGNNTLQITASNTDGSDAATATVVYKTKIISNPPIVTFILPTNNTSTISTNVYTYNANIINVPNSAGLVVKFNGTTISNYNYNGTVLNYNANLIEGNNTLEVTATNNDGADTKMAIVNYKPIVIPRPPVVTFVLPANNTSTISTSTFVYKANIINVPNSSGLVVKFNGTALSNYNYNGSLLSYNAALIGGKNTLEVTATNNDGTDSKTATVHFTRIVTPKPPIVTIISPAAVTPTVTMPMYSFNFSTLNVAQNQVTVKLNNNLISNFSFNNGNGTFINNLVNGLNTLEVSATNNDGTDTKIASVYYKTGRVASASTNTVEFNTNPTQTNTVQVSNEIIDTTNQKITICYKLSPTISRTLLVPVNQLPDYLALGAKIGACESGVPSDTTDKKITICYKVPGSTIGKTITIRMGELPKYLALGASIGKCPVANKTSNTGSIKTGGINKGGNINIGNTNINTNTDLIKSNTQNAADTIKKTITQPIKTIGGGRPR